MPCGSLTLLQTTNISCGLIGRYHIPWSRRETPYSLTHGRSERCPCRIWWVAWNSFEAFFANASVYSLTACDECILRFPPPSSSISLSLTNCTNNDIVRRVWSDYVTYVCVIRFIFSWSPSSTDWIQVFESVLHISDSMLIHQQKSDWKSDLPLFSYDFWKCTCVDSSSEYIGLPNCAPYWVWSCWSNLKL